MEYKFELKDLPTRLTLAIHIRSSVQDLPQVLGEVYGAIMAYMEELGETPTGMPFVIYYNLDMENLDIEAGFPVSKKLPDKDTIKASEINSGKFATAFHVGPYEKMEAVYNGLNQWINDNGYGATGTDARINQID